MYIKERQNTILSIIRERGFVTVAALTEILHYSTATINRDLNALEKQNLIKRSYGGAEPVVAQVVTHTFRAPKMRRSKRKIAARTASLVEDGDFIFLDGSTTVEYMAQFLRERKNLTVLTNNCLLAAELFPYGIKVVCLGGDVTEEPCITGGELCFDNASSYHVDKMFFSTGGITESGDIQGHYTLHILMLKNAAERWLLIDKEKVGRPTRHVLCRLSALTGVISDYNFPEETKAACPETRFICTEAEDDIS